MFLFLLGRYIELELLNCVISVTLIFKGTINLFSKVDVMHHFTFPSAMCEGSNHSKSLITPSIVSLSNFSLSDSCVSYCSFNLHFPCNKRC